MLVRKERCMDTPCFVDGSMRDYQNFPVTSGKNFPATHRRTPPVWMKPGDVLEVEISGIGILRNPVVAE
jgi:2-keto-4-pentenoate hydratase/2-oxohepta-3-ene-1,7-dioic acid hydratase in catechol pathway